MHLGRLRVHTLRQQVILLLLPVLAFRLLFPAGFMPRFGDDLELSMQMCHGDAQSSVIIRLFDDAPTSPAGDTERHEAPCVFAAIGAFATPEPATTASVAAAHAIAQRLPVAPAPTLRLAHRPQSPRAPPLPV